MLLLLTKHVRMLFNIVFLGQIAQSVEQRTENPRVGGSIPSLGNFSSTQTWRRQDLRYDQPCGWTPVASLLRIFFARREEAELVPRFSILPLVGGAPKGFALWTPFFCENLFFIRHLFDG